MKKENILTSRANLFGKVLLISLVLLLALLSFGCKKQQEQSLSAQAVTKPIVVTPPSPPSPPGIVINEIAIAVENRLVDNFEEIINRIQNYLLNRVQQLEEAQNRKFDDLSVEFTSQLDSRLQNISQQLDQLRQQIDSLSLQVQR